MAAELGFPPCAPKMNNRIVYRLSSLAFGRTDAIVTQAVRYIIVGAIATCADVSVLYVLTSVLGVPYLLSAAFGFTCGLAVSYGLSIRWVFASRTLGNRTLEFAVFAVIGVVGLGLTEIILYVCVETFALHYMTAKAVAVVTVFAWNFGARRLLLFRRTDQRA